MKEITSYIIEKLKLDKDSKAPQEFDSLMKALMCAKKLSSAQKQDFMIYKTSEKKYVADVNTDNYKIGDDFENNTVVEIVKYNRQ